MREKIEDRTSEYVGLSPKAVKFDPERGSIIIRITDPSPVDYDTPEEGWKFKLKADIFIKSYLGDISIDSISVETAPRKNGANNSSNANQMAELMREVGKVLRKYARGVDKRYDHGAGICDII